MGWHFRPFQQEQSVISQTWTHLYKRLDTSVRSLHTGAPSCMVAKILTADELFSKTSLQEYLKKVETEYSDSLRVVNGSVAEEQCTEEQLRAKRAKLSLLAPLIHSIRQLDAKQGEMAETVTLLQGENNLLQPCHS